MIKASPFSNGAVAIRSPGSSFATIQNVLRNSRVACWDPRRLTQRHVIELPVTIQPLNDSFQPSAFEMAALTRDVSHCGIGLTAVRKVESQYLRVSFDNCRGEQNHSVVINIRHQTQQGATYSIGGQLELNWSELLQDQPSDQSVDDPAYKLALLMNIRPLLSC